MERHCFPALAETRMASSSLRLRFHTCGGIVYVYTTDENDWAKMYLKMV